jgi:hypothetical protein
MFDVGSGTVAGAVDASTRTGLVRVETQDGMVKHVERIHWELHLDLLCDGEVLHEGRIGPETPGPRNEPGSGRP